MRDNIKGRRIIRIRYFSAYETEAMKQFLENMASKGWILDKKLGARFIFAKSDPQQLTYAVVVSSKEAYETNDRRNTDTYLKKTMFDSIAIENRSSYENENTTTWEHIWTDGYIHIYSNSKQTSGTPRNMLNDCKASTKAEMKKFYISGIFIFIVAVLNVFLELFGFDFLAGYGAGMLTTVFFVTLIVRYIWKLFEYVRWLRYSDDKESMKLVADSLASSHIVREIAILVVSAAAVILALYNDIHDGDKILYANTLIWIVYIGALFIKIANLIIMNGKTEKNVGVVVPILQGIKAFILYTLGAALALFVTICSFDNDTYKTYNDCDICNEKTWISLEDLGIKTGESYQSDTDTMHGIFIDSIYSDCSDSDDENAPYINAYVIFTSNDYVFKRITSPNLSLFLFDKCADSVASEFGAKEVYSKKDGDETEYVIIYNDRFIDISVNFELSDKNIRTIASKAACLENIFN